MLLRLWYVYVSCTPSQCVYLGTAPEAAAAAVGAHVCAINTSIVLPAFRPDMSWGPRSSIMSIALQLGLVLIWRVDRD